MRNKIAGALVPSLWAAAALVLATSLIAEIAAAPTSQTGISSSTWTPITAVTALFFGSDAFHGDFALGPILFGLLAIAVVSAIAGAIGTGLIVYSLGRRPHPLAAALLGAAWGLATEIALVNLLCNWLQQENVLYESMPSWGWFVGMGAWGITLGLTLALKGHHLSAAKSDAGLPLPRPGSPQRPRTATP